MTKIFKLAFVILCILFVCVLWTAALEIYVSDSNVPNVKYEVDAQQTLIEAYDLYPRNQERRNERFAGLFGNLHPLTAGWNVAEGCSSFYRSLKTYTYVALNVTDDDNTTSIVRIYN